VEKTFQATKSVAKQLEICLLAHTKLRVEAKAKKQAMTQKSSRASIVNGKMLGLVHGVGANGGLVSTTTPGSVKNGERRKVHFGGLVIHQHERVCGGSLTIPSSGPPLGLGWNKLHTDTIKSFLEWDDSRSKQHQAEEDEAKEEHEEEMHQEQEKFGEAFEAEPFLPFQYHLDGKLEVLYWSILSPIFMLQCSLPDFNTIFVQGQRTTGLVTISQHSNLYYRYNFSRSSNYTKPT
jgi:hypothetical protein